MSSLKGKMKKTDLGFRKKILSIQSRLVCGYVGNNIAELAIQLYGLDVIAFPSVLFSTHTGISRIYGSATSKALFDELVEGIKAINVLKDVNNIITGYIGTAEIVESSAQFIKHIKDQYPDRLYICDPVMGDFDQGMYVSEEVEKSISEYLIPLADVMTPNHYELKRLLKSDADTVDSILEAVVANPLLSEKKIIVTGCILKDTPADIIDMLVIQNGHADRISSPKLDIAMVGAGDLFTAIISVQLAKGADLLRATELASESLYRALVYSKERGVMEMNSECLLHCLNLG